MALTLLGTVEKNHFKSGPGARVRPIGQASSDKRRWVAPEETFPNSGVVSWWQPSADAEQFKAWIFQIEESRTYDPSLDNHDLYSVRQLPSLAVELIDLRHLAEPEDIRLFLLGEGLPIEQCATKRLIFRDGKGLLLGPVELSVEGDRLFLEERDTPIAISCPLADFEPLQWNNHVFVAPELLVAKVGDLDISSNALFLKRMLRESRDISPAIIERAKLTDRLIGSYCSALEQMSPEIGRRQRLRRLKALSINATTGIPLEEAGLSSLLAIPVVVESLELEKKNAAASAIHEHRSQIEKLGNERSELEGIRCELQAHLAQLQEQVSSTQQQQIETIRAFNASLAKRFQEVAEDAPAFLGTVALIRAALGGTDPEVKSPLSSISKQSLLFPKTEQNVIARGPADIVAHTCETFNQAGFDVGMPTALLSSWAAGFVPLLCGSQAKEMLDVAACSLAGGKQFAISIPPTLSAPSDLLLLLGCSRTGVGTLGDFLTEARHTDELFLLVLDNLNLCQIDNVVVPILNNYASSQLGGGNEFRQRLYPTKAGMWPTNVLLAGIIIESPLALSMSRELWQYSCLIESDRRQLPLGVYLAESLPLATVMSDDWIEWRESKARRGGTSTQLVAKHVSRVAQLSMLQTSMLHRFASIIEETGAELEEDAQLSLFTRTAILPLAVACGVDPNELLKGCPIETIVTADTVKQTVERLKKLGMDHL